MNLALRLKRPRAAPVRPSAAPPLRRPLTPAVPAATLVPPVAVYLGAIGAVAVLHAASIPGEAGALTVLRAATLVAVLIPLGYLLRAVLEGVGGQRLLEIALPAGTAVLAVAVDGLLPGWWVQPTTLGLAFLATLGAQPAVRAWREAWLRHRPATFTLLASTEWGGEEALRRLEAIPGLKVTGALIPDCDLTRAERMLGRPVFCDLEGSPRLERRVVVSCPARDAAVDACVARLVARGHHITSESRVLREAEGRVDTERASPLNLILSSPMGWIARALSRLMDVVLSAVLLVLLAPVMGLVALAVRLDSPGPVFYRQRRVGHRGRPFDLIKFRSMRSDAEAATGPVWACADDPRVTRVGRILRRTRLDELPQLYNVLVGQMALVGPRPERPHFFEVLRRDLPLFELRTIVRPGVTGWAQVRAPYAADTSDARTKLGYDLFYVSHRSPWFDLAILFETVHVAFSGRGAR